MLQHRRVDDLARRAAGPLRQPLAQPPDLAGILDQREPGAQRRRAADRDIGRRRHREAHRGKAEHQLIGVLAHGQMLAFAHHVPDIAEHEEIAGHRARQARDIVGFAGHEASGKALGKMRRRALFRDRVAHARQEIVAERDVLFPGKSDKAVGEIGVVGGKRRLDVLADEVGVIPQGRIELDVGKLGRIVLRRQHGKCVPGVRP